MYKNPLKYLTIKNLIFVNIYNFNCENRKEKKFSTNYSQYKRTNNYSGGWLNYTKIWLHLSNIRFQGQF